MLVKISGEPFVKSIFEIINIREDILTLCIAAPILAYKSKPNEKILL